MMFTPPLKQQTSKDRIWRVRPRIFSACASSETPCYDLKKIVAEGKGKMKPIHAVSGAAVENVVAYVRSLKK